jgi:hypothetical protein
MASASPDNGTRCVRPFLVRAPSNLIAQFSKSISDQRRPPISSRRWPVSMSNLLPNAGRTRHLGDWGSWVQIPPPRPAHLASGCFPENALGKQAVPPGCRGRHVHDAHRDHPRLANRFLPDAVPRHASNKDRLLERRRRKRALRKIQKFRRHHHFDKNGNDGCETLMGWWSFRMSFDEDWRSLFALNCGPHTQRQPAHTGVHRHQTIAHPL